MLSWFARKICWLNQRKAKKEKPTAIPQTKWHKACYWLAHSVGGVDMLLRDDRSIAVVSKASLDPETLDDGVISKSKHGTRSYLRVYLLVDEESKKFEFKTIDAWSESLAKFIATLIALTPIDPYLDPPENWGIMTFNHASSDGLTLKSEVLFPTFKSEEELFMRMALDGFDINDDEEKKDSADAQG